jgi:hypothetical protein
MDDIGIIDLDSGVAVEKRERGHPQGSKNKPKVPSLRLRPPRQPNVDAVV